MESNKTTEDGININDFLKFEVKTGGEDSADVNMLNFNVSSQGLQDGELSFKIEFENPNFVSIGSHSDTFIVTVFFPSITADSTIPDGYQIESQLPKILRSDGFYAALTEENIESTAKAVTITQIVIIIILTVSMKLMWNLLNVVQVLTYMKFFTRFPALMELVFTMMEDAITLKLLTDPVFDFGKSKFQIA